MQNSAYHAERYICPNFHNQLCRIFVSYVVLTSMQVYFVLRNVKYWDRRYARIRNENEHEAQI